MTLPCPCGKTLKVSDELAGKRVKCPGCGGVLTAPEALAELEPLDDDAPDAAGGPAEPGPRAPARKKKKKKKRAKTREEVDAEYERWVEKTYWRKRIFRGSAFIVLGLIIIAGGTYLLALHHQDVRPIWSVLILLTGVAGVLKGLFGLFFGKFFGEDE
jgi:hypothetical protein